MTGTCRYLAAAILGVASAALVQAGELYLADQQGQLWKLDTQTEQQEIVFAGWGSSIQAIALAGQTAFLTQGGRLWRVDLSSGETLGSFWANNQPTSLSRYGATLYISGPEYTSWVTSDDGDELDTYYLNDPINTLTMFGNTVYAGSLSTAIYSWRVGDGANASLFAICGGSVNAMTTNGTDLIAGSVEGTIYIFDAQNGTYKTTYPVDSDCVGVEYLDGSLFIVGSDGLVREMNLANGSIVRTINTGLMIESVAKGGQCLSDFDGNGTTNTLDFLSFLNAWAQGQRSADLDENDLLNSQDVLIYLNAYASDCDS